MKNKKQMFLQHNLLMPDKWIKRYVFLLKNINKDVNPENLSELFGVSKNAIYFRIKDLDLI